jgi:hypothetical protein
MHWECSDLPRSCAGSQLLCAANNHRVSVAAARSIYIYDTIGDLQSSRNGSTPAELMQHALPADVVACCGGGEHSMAATAPGSLLWVSSCRLGSAHHSLPPIQACCVDLLSACQLVRLHAACQASELLLPMAVPSWWDSALHCWFQGIVPHHCAKCSTAPVSVLYSTQLAILCRRRVCVGLQSA